MEMIPNNVTQSTSAGIRQVMLVTEDPALVAGFYREVLGLTELFRDGTRWIQFDAGAASLALATPEEASLPAGTSVPVFEVGDLDSALSQAQAAGATLHHQRDMGDHGRLAILTGVTAAPIALLMKGGR